MRINELLQGFGAKLDGLSQQTVASVDALNFAFPSLKSTEACVS